MNRRIALVLLVCTTASVARLAEAQLWQQNDQIFNPSGVPSLLFSQPRFADLDGDGDYDLILGSSESRLLYYQNTGTPTSPAFSPGPDIFAPVELLDAEVGAGVDLDADGDLDLITGGYNGLVFFENTGTPAAPAFTRHADFFADLQAGTFPVPTLADLDDDQDPDMLVGISESGVLKFYPNSGTPNAAAFAEAQSQDWFDVGLYAYPWFVDLDGDLDTDLTAGRDAHGFVHYRNEGDPGAWNWVPDATIFAGLGQATYWNSPCLVDLSGDGRVDLLFGTSAGPLQYYLNGGPPQAPVWTANTTLFGGVIDVGGASSPFFFDFDLDGDLDMVSGTQLGDIKYYRNVGTPEAPAWLADPAYFASIDHSIYAAIALGCLDGDALPDAVAGDLSGNLFFHRNTGSGFEYDSSVFSGINVGGWSVPRLVDMDGDDDLDLVVGNEAGRLRYFQNVGIGTMAWQEITGFFGTIDVGSNCSMTLGDYDLDGDIDLLTGDIGHELQYFRRTGGAWQEDPAIVAGLVVGQNAAPAFGDLDGDGDLDLAVGNYSGTFNYFRNDNAVTVVPEDAPAAPPELSLRAAPNPFADATTVRFALPTAGPVDLSIYDVSGRRIARLAEGYHGAGEHVATWRRDTGAPRLAGGVYYCRLHSDGATRTVLLTIAR